MQFTLTIDCDSAAFQDYSYELPRLIRKVADAVTMMGDDGLLPTHTRSVLDLNSNRVGSWAIKEEA